MIPPLFGVHSPSMVLLWCAHGDPMVFSWWFRGAFKVGPWWSVLDKSRFRDGSMALSRVRGASTVLALMGPESNAAEVGPRYFHGGTMVPSWYFHGASVAGPW